MASTAGAYEAVAAIRQRQLLAFLSALDAFHVAEAAIDAGLDPTTGAALAPGGAQAALSSAVADLATALHAAIDTGWSDAFAAASRQVWGGRDPGEAARRALASEVASQKAFATRFAADVAAGVPQQPGRWPEGRRATAYADAATAGYQISAAIGSPDGTLIWWRLGEVSRHCYLCPIHAANSPFTRESLPSTPRDGATPCVFTPESEVLTRRGNVPIRDVVVGDEVWTHRSRWRRVTNTFANPSNGRRGVVINGVGFTEDHRLWTLDGWRRAHDVASLGLQMIRLQHAKELREVFGDDALGSSYESVPAVRELLRLREAEGPARGGVPVVRHEPQGNGAVAGSGAPCEDPRWDRQGGETSSDDVRSPDMVEFQESEEGGRSILHDVLGRRCAPVHLQISVAVDEGSRSHPERDGDPSHQRGSDRRPDREPDDDDGDRAPIAPSDARESDEDGHRPWRLPERDGHEGVRNLSEGVHRVVSCREGIVREVLLSRVLPPQHDQASGEAVCGVRGDVPAEQIEWPEVLLDEVLRDGEAVARDCDMSDVRKLVRVPAPQVAPAEVLLVEVLPAHVYDLEVEEDRSFLVGGIFAENCKSACKCSLSFTEPTTPPLRTGPEVDEETQRNRQFEDRVFLPPPAPPGLRLPNADERGVLRDLEIQRNEARRRLHEAEVAGRKDEVKAWAGRSRDLTRQIREYAQDRGVHHVPTFRVEDVISGKDIGRRDIDRLTHFRGIDGVSISRAQAQAIRDAATAAKRDVLRVLEGYPGVDAVSREEWRDVLRRAGAPASAFGAPLVRVGEATDGHCGDEACDACHAPGGAVSICARPVLSAVRAVEARVPDVQAETVDDPADWRIVNAVAATARETLQNHVAALDVLANAGRRTGIAPCRVEVGPFTDGWEDLVAVGGTWVQGPASEVSRFLEAWAASSPAPVVTAPWQPIG